MAYWPGEEGESATEEQQDQKIDKPRLYKVLLHNDNYTTMDFVIHVLVNIFHKPKREATKIMFDVHRRGVGLAGVYPRNIAETKVQAVITTAQNAEFPLMCTMEPE